jgi:hypothetical protein
MSTQSQAGLFVVGVTGEDFVAECNTNKHQDEEEDEQAVHGDLQKRKRAQPGMGRARNWVGY